MANIVIGIQARSTSSRLPNKSLAMLDNRPMIDQVLDRCYSAAQFINNRHNGNHASCWLLIPLGDPIRNLYLDNDKIGVFEGNEQDVLSRYISVLKDQNPDYVVRVTGDCPAIPSFMITTHITRATEYGMDYVSNVEDGLRTYPDGYDCEVISSKAMYWLLENSKTDEEKEHVTIALRKNPPPWMKIGHVVGHSYLPEIKLSVDTDEDLKNMKEQYRQIKGVLKTIREKFPSRKIFRV